MLLAPRCVAAVFERLLYVSFHDWRGLRGVIMMHVAWDTKHEIRILTKIGMG